MESKNESCICKYFKVLVNASMNVFSVLSSMNEYV